MNKHFIRDVFKWNSQEYRTILEMNLSNTNIVDAISLRGDWCDQGRGNRKGRIRFVLKNNSQIIDTIDYNQIAPHTSSGLNFIFINKDNKIYDELLVQIIVGGGGGHRLHIDAELNIAYINLEKNSLVSVILPTLNRLEGFKKVVLQILNQTHQNFELIIIDDGSDKNILLEKEEFINNTNNPKIKFLKNSTNKKIPYTINKGINNSSGDYITWVSDDNEYYDNFIKTLLIKNYYFTYSQFNLKNHEKNVTKLIGYEYTNVNNLIKSFQGLGSFMYSRELLNKIGNYDENLFGAEDYEYLLRIYNNIDKDKIKYIPVSTMLYNSHSGSVYLQQFKRIRKLTDNINLIYKIINKNKDSQAFLYYSKTRWSLLFQRPHQIMRFMNKDYLKIFITSDDICEYEESNNLLIINYKFKNIIFNNYTDIIIYFTDTRLYHEIKNLPGKKLFDLIDAPINEFEVWRPNLEISVKNSDYVMYSHPNLVTYLNEIDNKKKYHYISTTYTGDHLKNEINVLNKIIKCNKKILIVLDKYLKGGLEKHTDLLQKEFICDVMVFDESVKEHNIINNYNYTNYDVILWQNVYNKIPKKLHNQKYIYVVHNSMCGRWSNKHKEAVKNNDCYIDTYIYVSDIVKKNFENNILIPKNSYIIENQIPQIENVKEEISGLFVSSGSYNTLKGHLELIKEFSKLDKNNTLEIYGDVHDLKYFKMLQAHIDDNKLDNIKLFEYTDNYIERLKEAEFFCLFSKSEGCCYSILEAIGLNKKIICTSECLTTQTIWYPNKYIFKKNDFNPNWFQIKKVDYLSYSYKHFINPFQRLLNQKTHKSKRGYITVSDITDVLYDLNNKNISEKNGYSALLRIKNEEETIEKCILDIVDLVDEIIIVDNNSTDNTLNIIKKLETIYDNIYVYQYNINIPRYGNEHIENYKKTSIGKNNTLCNYYNWTASKANYNKKIKWDGDFYCIRNNLKQLLDDFKNDDDFLGVHFSGLTLFVNGDNYYIKNNSYYNEFRLFCNKNKFIWSDNIFNKKNYCETSDPFQKSISNTNICLFPCFIEVKLTTKDEFSSRSIIDVDDGRDMADRKILNNLRQNIIDEMIDSVNNLYYSINNYYFTTENIGDNDFTDKQIYNLKYLKTQQYQKIFKTNFRRTRKHVFKKQQNILLIIDSLGWAFDNISSNIIKYQNTNKYNIQRVTYPELIQKIQKQETLNVYRKNIGYNYCNIDLNFNFNKVILFWYGDETNIILDYYKKKTGKVYLTIYDYSQWINNKNKRQEMIYKKKLDYFITHIDGYLYGCPSIKNILNKTYINNNLPSYPCCDGVDSTKFNCNSWGNGYNIDIVTKQKLTIGWIGNSNPAAHGINKGFEIIKNTVNNLSNKFTFKPQDIYTGSKLPHDKIPQYIKGIDIIICFSIAEGTPNQILEASSSGKCWISTNVGIVSELNNTIENNNCGIIINRSEDDLVEALLKLYNNRKLIIEYGKNGREAIEKSWDWSIKVNQFYDFFTK